ncbi:MAG: hypothetical protein K2P84_03275 [Undibacterium sp.]|nr:hypothetical protein [Undibacterium sp.]
MIPIIKQCQMNCSLPTGDPRTKKEMIAACDDCYVFTERDFDFNSVQRLATAMILKLDKKREEGRTGWFDASAGDLSKMLIEHVKKGDPVDVANFCMMLFCTNNQIQITKNNDSDSALTGLRAMISDDKHACTFQSMGQYRKALIDTINQVQT